MINNLYIWLIKTAINKKNDDQILLIEITKVLYKNFILLFIAILIKY